MFGAVFPQHDNEQIFLCHQQKEMLMIQAISKFQSVDNSWMTCLVWNL